MDMYSQNVYIKEVNKNIETELQYSWDDTRDTALNEVVDANTEFKKDNEGIRILVSPQESFGLSHYKILKLNESLKETQTFADYVIDSKSEDCENSLENSSANVCVPQVHTSCTERNMANKTNLSSFSKETTSKSSLLNTLENFNTKMMTNTKEDIYMKLNGDFQLNELKSKSLSSTPVSIHQPIKLLRRWPADNARIDSASSVKSISSLSTSSLADKMAWAFRAARDRLDSASNLSECSSNFDLESNCSEQAETMSTISDVSGYEEEMYRIRRLLLQDSPPILNDNSLLAKSRMKCKENNLNGNTCMKETPVDSYDIQIYRLQTQLQSAVKEKEKLAVTLSEVETKISVEWHDKFQVVLREKAHLEGRLESMQAEVEALKSEREQILDKSKSIANDVNSKTVFEAKKLFTELENLTIENGKLLKQIREIDIKCQERKLQLELLESEKIQLKSDLKETELSNESLRITLQELRVEFESKVSAIEGLKKKITDLHIECQSLLQAKLKAENSSSFFKSELEETRKTFSWYHDQLQNGQEAKVKVQQELMATQTNLVTCNHLVEKIKGEKSLLLQEIEETQKRAVREKECLLRKLELIQADMLEREATILMHVHKDNVASETISLISAKLKYLEEERLKQMNTSFEEQQMKIEDLKTEIKSKENAIESLELENSNLLKTITTLQKTMNEKEICNQIFENKFKHLEMVQEQLTDALKSKDELLLSVKNEKVTLEVALSAAAKEKLEVDTATAKLREDFSQMANSFKSMKLEIQSKEQQIKDLKDEIKNLICNNQLLVANLEEKSKEETVLMDMRNKIISLGDLEQKINELTHINEDLNRKLREKNETLTFCQSNLSKLEETLIFREQQLHNQTHNFEVYQYEMKTRENKIMELENEKQLIVSDKDNLQLQIKELGEVKSKLIIEMESYKSQLKQANIVIEQFNDLCKGTEKEKHEIHRQLKLALKDLEKVHSNTKVHLDTQVDIQSANVPILENDDTISKNVMSRQGTLQYHSDQINNVMDKIEADIVLFLDKNEYFDLENLKVNSNGKENDLLFRLLKILSAIKTMSTKLTQTSTEIEKMQNSKSILECELFKLKDVLKLSSDKDVFHPQESKETQTTTSNFKDFEANNANQFEDKVTFQDREIKKLKNCLKMQELEQQDKYRRYESNIRTLLKKVKEHLRGRKLAEKELEQLRGPVHSSYNLSESESLKLEIKKMEAALEHSNKQLEEQRKIAEKNQISLLELEKEKGKLVQNQDTAKEGINMESCNKTISYKDGLDQKARDIKYHQMSTRIVEIEEEAQMLVTTINELKKQLFAEKCESSQLRKQLASLQLGLNNANDVIDKKNKELKHAGTKNIEVQEKYNFLKNDFELEKDCHEKCKLNLEKLKGELEQTKVKDPLLADQIKTLSYHLHQRQQEIITLQQKLELSESNWATVESGYKRNLDTLQSDVQKLQDELEVIRKDKFTLKAQTAELRACLQSTIDQNKMLKLKLDDYSCDNKLKLPDLTSSLPSPPVIYDDAQIAELLHYSTVIPQNKPLNNLQCCLDSLKQEMASLQMQIAAKTSGYVAERANESKVQNI